VCIPVAVCVRERESEFVCCRNTEIILTDTRKCVPVTLSMLKSLLLRDSGSLEILQYTTQRDKHKLHRDTLRQHKQNIKKNTLKPQQIPNLSAFIYETGANIQRLHWILQRLFYFTIQLIENTHKHWENGQCICLWMLFITQPQGWEPEQK